MECQGGNYGGGVLTIYGQITSTITPFLNTKREGEERQITTANISLLFLNVGVEFSGMVPLAAYLFQYLLRQSCDMSSMCP